MKRVLKWGGIAIGSLVGLIVVALGIVYGVSEYRLRKTYDVPPSALALHSDPTSIARGKHIAVTRGCTDCHAADFSGTVFLDAGPVGRLFASNLTSGKGGIGGSYKDADWERAIRHGVRPDGKPLRFMPSHEFYPMSDEDIAAMVAYLKSLPPVDKEPVPSTVGPLGRVLFVAGMMPLVPAELIDHDAPRPRAPVPGPTAEYGGYLATGCVGCHGMGFSGGKIPGAPPSMPVPTNITRDRETGIGAWTEQDFFRAIREGKRPDGSELNPFMPWKNLAQMSDDEIRAMWLYLNSLPPKPEGGR